MRKWVIASVVVVAIAAVIALLSGATGGNEGYVIRAIFDNGSFMVSGEQVRVAGATVGQIESVGVTMPGEIDSYKHGSWRAIPGKAVLVMKITDPGFQDFRRDASCLIRPQSLIGEKFIDCRPTLPRAPGSPPPPRLRKIPDGEPGAGQYLLPLENNSTSVDPDLVNNIQQLPYAQRFRLILNELGAGLAGRGEDLEEVVKRANPTLRDVDRLFGILRAQRNQLAQLAADSEQILRPLSRERAHVAGFLGNAGATAQASAERGAALEASLHKFPRFLREFRKTLRSFQGFSEAATPVFSELGRAAPSLTRATRALSPFLDASTISLKSLGAAGEVAGPKLRAADPLVRKVRDLAKTGVSPTTRLADFLNSTKETKGFDGLVELIYNSTGAVNEFDRYGHFVRSLVRITNCVDYKIGAQSGCTGNFNAEAEASSAFDPAAALRWLEEHGAFEEAGGEEGAEPEAASGAVTAPEEAESRPSTPTPSKPSIGKGRRLGARSVPSKSQRALLDYLLAP